MSDASNIIQLVPAKPTDERAEQTAKLVANLREMLAMAEAGELHGYVAAFASEDTYYWRWAGSCGPGNSAEAAALASLLAAKMQKIYFRE